MMLSSRPLTFVVLLVLGIAIPALANGGPSLRGVLRALERRRRAPSGPTYPLASFQYPDKALEYLTARGDYQSEDSPIFMDPNDRDKALEKAVVLSYLDKDEDYSSDEPGINYKRTAFRERINELKARRKRIMEKKRSSAFRERAGKHSLQSDRLKELFFNDLADEEEKQKEEIQLESDAEYVELLKDLWDKYKYSHPETSPNDYPEEMTRIYKDRNIRKRQIPGEYLPSGWGPIAFKKKRSSNQRLDDADTPNDFLYSLKFISQSDPSMVENLKDDKVIDEDEDPDVSKMIYSREQEPRYSPFDVESLNPPDVRDEYMIELQPSNNIQSNEEENEFAYESDKEKRFPVSKRNAQLIRRDLVKRNLHNNKRKLLRSSGTDPNVIKELSSLFGEINDENDERISKPVKRSSTPDDDSHEIKNPMVSTHETNTSHTNHSSDHHHHNSDHDHDADQDHHHHNSDHDHDSDHDDHDHDHPHSRHEHENKPPLLIGSEGIDYSHEQEDTKEMNPKDDQKSQLNVDHPIILKKKSIDWSNYFGMDKRKKKSYEDSQEYNALRNLYLGTAKRNFNQYPLGNLRIPIQPVEEPINVENNRDLFETKRKRKQIEQLKLDTMDNKLKNMESVIVDEALQYSGAEDGLDTKEEQDVKEKILSRLAAAYSLEKMRKALKEFKLSLQSQRNAMKDKARVEFEEDKEKRMDGKDDKKKKKSDNAEIEDSKPESEHNGIQDKEDIDFESEQGAGHFLNGQTEPLSEGYMGGSGMKNKPNHVDMNENGQCPVLDKIVRRCHSIDILVGDHNRLFLSLCSLHQICYLCGPSSPTGCDLIFLSEADSVCGGRASCQQAARAALMALREEHDSLADDLDGECERGSCLYHAIENNSAWQHTFKR